MNYVFMGDLYGNIEDVCDSIRELHDASMVLSKADHIEVFRPSEDLEGWDRLACTYSFRFVESAGFTEIVMKT